jgi:hypothetical protein
MTLRLFWLISLSILVSSSLFAQRNGGKPGQETYYQYEREVVSNYRDLADFTRPEPTLPERERRDLPKPISLEPYFGPGQDFYIDADQRLEKLRQIHIAIGRKTTTMEGFRIMIYSGNSRNRALGVKSQLLAMGLDQKPYLEFDAPNFVVRVGDFMDRENAILFLRDLQDQYPSAFIVPDKINIPKYKEDLDEADEFEDPFAPNNDHD